MFRSHSYLQSIKNHCYFAITLRQNERHQLLLFSLTLLLI